MTEYYDLKDSAIKLLESNGHKITFWHDYSEHMYSIYSNNHNYTKGYGNCDYCKMNVSIDLYPLKNEPQMQGDVFLHECIAKNMTKDETGIAAITYDICWKCNKKISPRSKAEVMRGVHNKCKSDNWEGTFILDIHDNQIHITTSGI